MKQSPTFRHAVESFEHGLEHYLEGSERSRKFALLHVDQAVELFLKEKIVELGKTVYKSSGTTLNLHEAFTSLKILERPRLEELHQLRNAVQHKGLTPDAQSTQFYVQIAYRFLKRFLSDELGCPLNQIVSSKHRALMEAQPLEEAAEVAKAFERATKAENPTGRIMRGYMALSLAVKILEDQSGGKVGTRHTIRLTAKEFGVPAEQINSLIREVFDIRNQVVHTAHQPTEDEAEAFLENVRSILRMLHCIS